MAVMTSVARRGGAFMRSSLMAAAISLSLLGLSAAGEVSAAIRKDTNIPPEGLEQALATLAEVHNFQVLYRTEVVNALTTQGVIGQYTPEEALKQLLKGTGLTYRFVDEKTITIVAASSAAPARADKPADTALLQDAALLQDTAPK